MIPLPQKEELIKNLQQGMNLVDACKASKVPRASLYRLFNEQPGLKKLIDQVIEETKEKTAQKNMDYLKKLVMKKKE